MVGTKNLSTASRPLVDWTEVNTRETQITNNPALPAAVQLGVISRIGGRRVHDVGKQRRVCVVVHGTRRVGFGFVEQGVVFTRGHGLGVVAWGCTLFIYPWFHLSTHKKLPPSI